MIQINLLRVSADSQYLEISIECPTSYYFNIFNIKRYLGSGQYTESLDLSDRLSGETREIIQIPTSIFGTDVTMYWVELGVISDVPGAPAIDPAIGIVSNVNFVYANLLDLIMKLTDGCISQADYDVLDRNHMILYAHQEAMRLLRLEEAERFYDIIWKLFSKCGPTTRQYGIINNPCNC